MATLKPFAALRPKPELAAQICELPYDVMSSDEAREMARGKSVELSARQQTGNRSAAGHGYLFAGSLCEGQGEFSETDFAGRLETGSQPDFYLYRQIMGKHAQIGLVAAASCEEYLDGIIKKHEFTRPDKEDDRVRHIETLNSQTGPVFLTYRAVAALDEFVAKKIAETPDD